MESLHDVLERNLQAIRGRIVDAATRADRSPDSVSLIPVTKSVDVDHIRALARLGCMEIAENRVDAARDKRNGTQDIPLCWHMVGNLQRRKAADALDVFDTIDAVDRLALAQTLNRVAENRERIVPVLLEVNVSGEESKHGFSPAELEDACAAIQSLSHLRVDGLMTMAPFVDDPEATRPVFRALRELGNRLGLRELSMGMSNDFEVAVEEGATQVRIGTALFA